jgi:AmmeMemoRadiSam system protein A
MKMDKKFTEDERKFLVELAKSSAESFTKSGKEFEAKNIPESLKENLACFVTIYKSGELRGCIGTLEPYEALYKSVIENAIAAVSRDRRFDPVAENELQYLEYEVSILTKPEKIYFTSREELFNKIRGKGVTIEKGYYRSTYLPQVWEHFKNEEEFLSSLCRKAGMSGNEWEKTNKSGIDFSVYDTIK